MKTHSVQKKSKTLNGIGVHNGLPAELSFDFNYEKPGIWFQINGHIVEAHYKNVKNTQFCTVIGDDKTTVNTIEHLMSALAAYSVTNVLVTINGENEVPILDGSALQFCKKILESVYHTHEQMLVIKKTVRVSNDHGYAELIPYPSRAFQVEIKSNRSRTLDQQVCHFDFMCDNYLNDIAPCKTFGFKEDAKKLHQNRLALGANAENTVIIDGDHLLNPAAFAHREAFAAHKVLDALGDLYLAGYPILGFFKGFNTGHTLNYLLVEKIFSDSSNYEIVKS